MLPNSSEAAWLGVIRILTGAIWLTHGIPKLLNPKFAMPDGMMAGMVRDMSAGASGPYQSFLNNVVLPHAPVFAHLVAWGETLTGVSLLIGLFGRIGAFSGMFLTLNYMLAKGSFGTIMGYGGLDFTTFVLSATNLVLPTSMRFGLDGLLFGGEARRSLASPPEWAKSR